MALSRPMSFGGFPVAAPLLKELTFSNDTGTVALFTVTGDVLVQIEPICKTNVASAAAANMRMGISTDTDSMIADTLATKLAAGEIWIDTEPDSKIEAMSSIRDHAVSGGEDVILTLSGQVDSGVIHFKLWWVPVSDDGMVVVA